MRTIEEIKNELKKAIDDEFIQEINAIHSEYENLKWTRIDSENDLPKKSAYYDIYYGTLHKGAAMYIKEYEYHLGTGRFDNNEWIAIEDNYSWQDDSYQIFFITHWKEKYLPIPLDADTLPKRQYDENPFIKKLES